MIKLRSHAFTLATSHYDLTVTLAIETNQVYVEYFGDTYAFATVSHAIDWIKAQIKPLSKLEEDWLTMLLLCAWLNGLQSNASYQASKPPPVGPYGDPAEKD